MKTTLRFVCMICIAAFAFLNCFVCNAIAQTSVLTQHYDLKRTGWNNHETSLNQSNVNVSTFGKLYSLPVDEQIYAQPLIVGNITVNGKARNMLYTATVNNSLYAFDADDASGTPLWQISLTPSGFRAINHNDFVCDWGGYSDFQAGIGIVGTPVIDPNTKTLYVVARSISTSNGTFVQYLHAIDITTGAEKANSPTYITGSVSGTSPDAVNGRVSFDQQLNNQRPGLCLYNNVVYICWASHCDHGHYHGWVMGYDAKTLQQKYIYCATPNGTFGGIWMSGQAPAVDDQGYVYVAVGNGSVGYNGNQNDAVNRGESIVNFQTQSGSLQVADFFTPHNWLDLENGDLDYGSDGVTLIPNTNLSISGSKQSYLYAVNTTNMGKTTANDVGAKQILDINAEFTGNKNIHGTPVYFKNNLKQEFIYVWAEDALLKQIPFIRKQQIFDTTHTIVGTTFLPDGMPGGILSVSSNMSKRNTGIVWATHSIAGDATGKTVPGILQAFAADDITHELWNSQQNSSRDNSTTFAKFVPPVVANGKVYLATFSHQLIVYGIIKANGNAQTNSVKSLEETKYTNAVIDVFPNPAHSHFTLHFTSKASLPQKSLIMITNSLGKVVHKLPLVINPDVNTVNVNLPAFIKSGVYMVQLITEKGSVATKKTIDRKINSNHNPVIIKNAEHNDSAFFINDSKTILAHSSNHF